tara:strand:- start:209 stop:388 length:180 start_codon:yes stop_codon:yes gene_type:complete
LGQALRIYWRLLYCIVIFGALVMNDFDNDDWDDEGATIFDYVVLAAVILFLFGLCWWLI